MFEVIEPRYQLTANRLMLPKASAIEFPSSSILANPLLIEGFLIHFQGFMPWQ
jgi:hypothetical protein